MNNRIIQGDCLEEMDRLIAEDIIFDAIITDPPYGTTACSWDAIIPFEPMWERLNKLIKPNGAIVLFGSEPFSSYLRLSNIKNYKYDWVWDKHIPRGFQIAKYRPMMKHENVMVFGLSKINYYPQMVLRNKPITVRNYSKKDKISSSYVKYNNGKSYTYTHKSPDSIIVGCWEANVGKLHPTQKPVALMEYLIKTYTNEGEIVLDFAEGSFTTAIACLNTKRNFICIEKEPEYVDIGEKRIEAIISVKT